MKTAGTMRATARYGGLSRLSNQIGQLIKANSTRALILFRQFYIDTNWKAARTGNANMSVLPLHFPAYQSDVSQTSTLRRLGTCAR
ncbi:protein of unknown function [Paraburkholderia dioscoreae]|uniref:Uncharacterized protein n=1 Tax=Paraburkholderia dioscoreae TaxID=2604047 RepID=A0A5Q4ZAK8_9BURK|nr:protein of unknown function [Paraburkholderia dioscoreae]